MAWGGRGQRGFVIGLLLIVMAVVGAVLFVVGTASGAALLLRVGLGLAGEGSATGVRGSLYQGLAVAELRYRAQGIQVDAAGVHLEVDWLALRQGELRVVEASVTRLHLVLPAAEPPAPDEPPPRLPPPPAWAELPLAVQLRYVAVGELRVWQGDTAVPFALDHAAIRASLTAAAWQAELLDLTLTAPAAQVRGHGQLRLSAPDPLSGAPALDLNLVLAVRQEQQEAAAELVAEGTLEQVQLRARATGYDVAVDATATLAPFSETLPVQALQARVQGVRPAAWVPGLPDAVLSFDLDLALAGALWPADQMGIPQPEGLRSTLRLAIDPSSRWQGQPLQGQLAWQQQGWQLSQVQADLRLGRNQVQLQGAVGQASDTLRYTVTVPAPGQIWPGLQGGLSVRGELQGLPEQHRFSLQGRVELPPELLAQAAAAEQARVEPVLIDGQMQAPADDPAAAVIDLPAALAKGPYQVDLVLGGRWDGGTAEGALPGRMAWRGQLDRLVVRNAEVGLSLRDAMAVAVAPATSAAPLAWQVGATRLQLSLPHGRQVVLVHAGSRGAGAQWRSAGQVDNLVPAWVIAQLPRAPEPLRLDLSWDVGVAEAFEGSVQVRRRAGDLVVPGEAPIALGLQELALSARATPVRAGQSAVQFNLDVRGSRIGTISAQGSTVALLRGGVPVVTERQDITLDARLALDDLGWLVAITGDENEVGGRLQGAVRLVRTGGQWRADGTLEGDELRVIRVDDGVRLLNGTLRARFTEDRIDVDTLRFQGAIRSAPRNAAVQAWVAQYGDAGYIQASGSWSLSNASGAASVEVSRYPLVQRADRFVAASGTIAVAASPQRFEISGKVTADIGWISLEGSDDLPSLSSDVVIVRTGADAAPPASLPLRLNLDIDFGNRMMLTGLGLNTELAGSINVRNTASGLRANGVVTTRDGRFSIYGQTLVVRQGTVTFQGLLDDPLLDIVAVRPNLPVEAGVQVGGTARSPEISLVSYPDVPEVEKLSWLLLGRGPDARGADTGLLLSAAASLLGGDGDPIYRELGLDELGLRSGSGSSVRGVLPDRTVVGSLSSAANADDVGQFLVAGKRLSDSLYLTFEQALSGRAAVLRASYRISETLSASVQGGTINGLRLVWSLLW